VFGSAMIEICKGFCFSPDRCAGFCQVRWVNRRFLFSFLLPVFTFAFHTIFRWGVDKPERVLEGERGIRVIRGMGGYLFVALHFLKVTAEGVYRVDSLMRLGWE